MPSGARPGTRPHILTLDFEGGLGVWCPEWSEVPGILSLHTDLGEVVRDPTLFVGILVLRVCTKPSCTRLGYALLSWLICLQIRIRLMDTIFQVRDAGLTC